VPTTTAPLTVAPPRPPLASASFLFAKKQKWYVHSASFDRHVDHAFFQRPSKRQRSRVHRCSRAAAVLGELLFSPAPSVDHDDGRTRPRTRPRTCVPDGRVAPAFAAERRAQRPIESGVQGGRGCSSVPRPERPPGQLDRQPGPGLSAFARGGVERSHARLRPRLPAKKRPRARAPRIKPARRAAAAAAAGSAFSAAPPPQRPPPTVGRRAARAPLSLFFCRKTRPAPVHLTRPRPRPPPIRTNTPHHHNTPKNKQNTNSPSAPRRSASSASTARATARRCASSSRRWRSRSTRATSAASAASSP